jgi:GT2 family glycosyltransferase
MLMNGFTIKYNPRAIMYHEHRSDMKGLRKQIFAYMKGHTAAALLQHEQYPQSGYHRRIFRTFPKNYLKSAIKGFPLYRAKFSTTWVEIRGILSGIAFYQKVKKKVS